MALTHIFGQAAIPSLFSISCWMLQRSSYWEVTSGRGAMTLYKTSFEPTASEAKTSSVEVTLEERRQRRTQSLLWRRRVPLPCVLWFTAIGVEQRESAISNALPHGMKRRGWRKKRSSYLAAAAMTLETNVIDLQLLFCWYSFGKIRRL